MGSDLTEIEYSDEYDLDGTEYDWKTGSIFTQGVDKLADDIVESSKLVSEQIGDFGVDTEVDFLCSEWDRK